MFLLLIGGVQKQVRQVLKSGSGRCIACGSVADLVEYDKTLKIFFVPVWKWPGKDPLLHCTNCGLFSPPSISPPPISDMLKKCHFCSRDLQSHYRFCPFCGSSL